MKKEPPANRKERLNEGGGPVRLLELKRGQEKEQSDYRNER